MPERLRLRLHPQAAQLVARRARLLAALRRHLDARGLLEADVPSLLPHAGQESHLHPPAAQLAGLPGPLWLQTSPELCLKRLLCAGVPRLYALGPAWRGGREELSTLHQPQFCMLEWYRPGRRVQELMDDVVALGTAAAAALEVAAPSERHELTVAEAFARHAGCSLEPLLDGDVPAFSRGARRAGADARDDDDPSTAFHRAVVTLLEPALARLRGWVFLHGYPDFGAALAQLSPEDPRTAQRVEAFLGGLELGNGYVELADPGEHRRRWAAERAARSDPPPPMDEELLSLLEQPGLPPSIGMALGVDRLMLALLGGGSLADVLPLSLELRDDG
jgi:lysyl-tRNA synthetase class 2